MNAAVAYKIGAACMALAPEPVARRLGHLAGKWAWRRADRRKRMAIRAMARVRGESPDDPSRVAIEMARELFSEYGRYWAEVLWLRKRRIPQVERHLSIDGIEHYRKALAEGKGVILALPHVGNWEIAGRAAVPEGAHLIAVAEQLDEREAEWFVRLRREMGIDIVLADGSAAVVDRLVEVLAGNGAVALLSDRDLSRRGAEVEFFGERTRLPTGAVALALRTGAPILPVASYNRSGRGHHIVVKPPLQLRSDDIADGVQQLARVLEDLISAAPTQWHMVSPNWPSDRAAIRA